MLTLTIRKTVTAHYYASISDANGQTLLLTPMCLSSSGCSGNVEKIMRRRSWTDHLQYRVDTCNQHYVVLVDRERHILAISPGFEHIDDLQYSVAMIRRSLSSLRASVHVNFHS